MPGDTITNKEAIDMMNRCKEEIPRAAKSTASAGQLPAGDYEALRALRTKPKTKPARRRKRLAAKMEREK